MIRQTNPADFEGLIEIAIASGLFDASQSAMISEMIRSPGETDFWFTAEDEAGPAGVAYVVPEKMTNGTWNLLFIAVHPRAQRQGLGKGILTHVQEWLQSKGERILIVETAGIPDFDYVRAFYAREGFEREARLRDFYDDGVDKVIFRKKLN
jgi:ribosomal protein S18 acetylase RimI-like enzyme